MSGVNMPRCSWSSPGTLMTATPSASRDMEAAANSAEQPSAVNAEALTVDPGTLIREHQGNDGGNVLRSTVAMGVRDILSDMLEPFLRIAVHLLRRGPRRLRHNRSRGHRVAADPLPAIGGRDMPGQGHDAGL